MKDQTSDISLEAIEVSTTNEMFRRPHELTNEALQELTNSIIQYEVIQPILIRPNPQAEGRYILISGERRFRASKLAGKTDIPAYVKDVSEEVALVLQITENMQREDIHPLNEAKGYRMILERNPEMTTAELALRFGKSETYVLQRMKLNDLVKEARKDFYANTMSLGHALILARLTPQDQREAIGEIVNHRTGYGTVNELQDFIDRNIINSLSKAPFNLNDEILYKKAGACVSCGKRSGASPLLFPEVKEKDKCFDRSCFFIKWQRFLLNKTKEVVETQPDIVFLASYHEPMEEISAILNEHKIKLLKEYYDFDEDNSGGAKTKGLWVSGGKAGRIVTVYLKKQVQQLNGSETENSKVLIAKIQQRMERGKELDNEKVHAKILDSLKNHPTQKKGHVKKIMADEEVLLWYIILDKAGYQLKRELMKFIGLTKEDPEKIYTILKKMKPEDKAFMLRRLMMDQYGGNYPQSSYGFIIRKIAAGYGDIDIKAFEKRAGHHKGKKRTARKREDQIVPKG